MQINYQQEFSLNFSNLENVLTFNFKFTGISYRNFNEGDADTIISWENWFMGI